MLRAMNLKSKSNIHNMLKKLEERGHITRRANRERAIIPTQLEEDP
jgi:SOS-response transcriptional repressor LexA